MGLIGGQPPDQRFVGGLPLTSKACHDRPATLDEAASQYRYPRRTASDLLFRRARVRALHGGVERL